LSVIEGSHTKSLIIHNTEDFERLDAIIDVNQLAGTDHFGDVLVVDIPDGVSRAKVEPAGALQVGVVAGRSIFVVRRNV